MRLSRRRRLPLLCVSVVLLAVSGCGSSDPQEGADPPVRGSDEQQVRSAVEGLYADLADYDAAAVCARMSPAARREIAEGAVGGKGGTCEKAFGEFLDLAKRNGGLKRTLTAEVGRVRIDGRDARVTVSFGQQSGQVPLREIDGQWRIGILAAPTSGP